jgi:hypothetical protein
MPGRSPSKTDVNVLVCRASTSCALAGTKDVDGRDEPGHDEFYAILPRFTGRAKAGADHPSSRRLPPPPPDEGFAYPSAPSSSSSLSSLPARICSAIRPEFARIAASILFAMSGLALRKVLAFSRPCPMRWLS